MDIPSRTELQEFVLDFYAVVDYSNEGDFKVVVDPAALVSMGTLTALLEGKADLGKDGVLVPAQRPVAEPPLKDAKAKTAPAGTDGVIVVVGADQKTKKLLWSEIKTVVQGWIDGRAVPVTRKVNGKALSAGVTALSCPDGAAGPIAIDALRGGTVQRSYVYEVAVSVQDGTPTPRAPIAVSLGLAAGKYAVRTHRGLFEVTVPEDVYSLEGAQSKIVLDPVAERAFALGAAAVHEFDGTESIGTTISQNRTSFVYAMGPKGQSGGRSVCTAG